MRYTVTKNNDDMWIDDEAVVSCSFSVHIVYMYVTLNMIHHTYTKKHSSPFFLFFFFITISIYYFIFCSICWFFINIKEKNIYTIYDNKTFSCSLRKISNLFHNIFFSHLLKKIKKKSFELCKRDRNMSKTDNQPNEDTCYVKNLLLLKSLFMYKNARILHEQWSKTQLISILLIYALFFSR